MLLFGLPVAVLGIVFSLVLAGNDEWDLQVDRVMYGVISVFMLVGWLVTLLRWRSMQWVSVGLFVGAGLFLLAKLLLLSIYPLSSERFIQEVAESLVWLPTFIIWTMLTELTLGIRRLLNTLMVGMVLISLYAILRPVMAGQQPDQDVLRTLVELNMACAVSLYGASYFLKRNDLLGRKHGERSALSRMTYTDLLTGLPGRLSLEQHLQRLTQPEPQSSQPAPFALLFVDVDSFKVVNDTLGHAVGDELLRGIAEELRRLAGKNGRVYRMSGDEFVVLLRGVTGDQAEAVAQRIQAEAARLPSFTVGTQVTLSIGLSICPEDATTPEELLRHADSAMFAVKRAGRRHVRRYQPEQDATIERIQVLARDLGHALERQELRLVFQPIYRLDTMQMVKAEALLRWDHATLGPVSPAEFIPVAERGGLITPIGEWVLREACLAAKQWPSLTVSVNVSSVQLIWSDFVVSVQDTLRISGINPQNLELEVTETAVLHEDDRAMRVLKTLRNMGVKVSIDDFGSGYSNLTRLRSMPITGVKLDRSIIKELPDDTRGDFSRALTLAAVGISRNMQVYLTAEGVETSQHLEVVRRLGCDLGQGYGLSLPITAQELLALYHRERIERLAQLRTS